jgi:hypothetical protein
MDTVKIPEIGKKDPLKRSSNGSTYRWKDDGQAQSIGKHGYFEAHQTKNLGDSLIAISINGDNGCIDAGGLTTEKDKEVHGRLVLRNADKTVTLILDGKTGESRQRGDIMLFDELGNERVRISAQDTELIIQNTDEKKIIHLDGDTGDISAGGNGQNGGLIINDSNGVETVLLDGREGNATINGNVGIGTAPTEAKLDVAGKIKAQAVETRKLELIKDDGSFGDLTVNTLTAHEDIMIKNADCAEDFDIAEEVDIEPGTVMTLKQEGSLCQSSEAYDKKVAGVISGAGDYKPGLILDKQPSQENRLPVALMGKVYCKVDADQAPIEVGDLLTTAPTPGHAMKAEDPFKAFGAVIGKALRPLEAGKGLIPVLVALQ